MRIPSMHFELHCDDLCLHCLICDSLPAGLYMGSSPPNKLLSQSTSVLYHKRSSDFNSSGNLSSRDRPESLLGKVLVPYPVICIQDCSFIDCYGSSSYLGIL